MKSKTFKDSVPHELVRNITAQCGRSGEEWFDRLPSVIEKLEKLWSIETLEPFPAIEYNYVAPAVRDDGEQVVLKISPPFETIEIFGEAAYLDYRKGVGAINLLSMNIEHRAILVERAFPGENLFGLFTGAECDSIQPAIDVLKIVLKRAPYNSVGITTLDDWFHGIRRFGKTDFPHRYATKALNIYDELSNDPKRIFYLHGDYHPGNVVNSTRAPYLAIDPKGIIGHLGYEIAVFLNNYHRWQENTPDIDRRLEAALVKFVDAFNMNTRELRQWAYAQIVLGSWWSFVDMPELYDNEVVKADVWDV